MLRILIVIGVAFFCSCSTRSEETVIGATQKVKVSEDTTLISLVKYKRIEEGFGSGGTEVSFQDVEFNFALLIDDSLLCDKNIKQIDENEYSVFYSGLDFISIDGNTQQNIQLFIDGSTSFLKLFVKNNLIFIKYLGYSEGKFESADVFFHDISIYDLWNTNNYPFMYQFVDTNQIVIGVLKSFENKPIVEHFAINNSKITLFDRGELNKENAIYLNTDKYQNDYYLTQDSSLVIENKEGMEKEQQLENWILNLIKYEPMYFNDSLNGMSIGPHLVYQIEMGDKKKSKAKVDSSFEINKEWVKCF